MFLRSFGVSDTVTSALWLVVIGHRHRKPRRETMLAEAPNLSLVAFLCNSTQHASSGVTENANGGQALGIPSAEPSRQIPRRSVSGMCLHGVALPGRWGSCRVWRCTLFERGIR